MHKIAKDDRSEDDEPELETDRLKDEAAQMLIEKVEALPLLSGHENGNGSANRTTKANGNGTAVPPVRRKSAR